MGSWFLLPPGQGGGACGGRAFLYFQQPAAPQGRCCGVEAAWCLSVREAGVGGMSGQASGWSPRWALAHELSQAHGGGMVNPRECKLREVWARSAPARHSPSQAQHNSLEEETGTSTQRHDHVGTGGRTAVCKPWREAPIKPNLAREGVLAASVGHASDSWFSLRSRSRGRKIQPHIRLHAQGGVCRRLSLCAPPPPPRSSPCSSSLPLSLWLQINK